MSRSSLTLARGILLGATLAHFLDPRRGRQRRARAMDLLTHLGRTERRLFAKAARDASHRARGVIERVLPQGSADPDDAIVEERVRAALGHVVSHASPIEVRVRDGSVVLIGPILEADADPAIRRLQRVAGVKEIVDRLERHATADIAAL